MIEYRKAELSDLEELLALRIEFLMEASGSANDAAAVEHIEELRAENEDFIQEGFAEGCFVQWLAVADGRVVATGSASFYRLPPNGGCINGKCAYIGNMYTRPAWRRQGMAEQILKNALSEAKSRGCRKVMLHATMMGRPLYVKLGFTDSADDMVYKF